MYSVVPPVITVEELLDTDSITLLVLLDFLTEDEVLTDSTTEEETAPSTADPEDSARIRLVEASDEDFLIAPFVAPLEMTMETFLSARSLSCCNSWLDAAPLSWMDVAAVELAAKEEDCIPLVITEEEDFTRVVNDCFLVVSDCLELEVDSLVFVTVVFVLLLAPEELDPSFFVTVILTAFNKLDSLLIKKQYKK